MIVLDNVSKTYRSWRGPGVRAVSNVTLEIARGEVLGIAGPNGAGKSTLIAMLLGMLSPDEGQLTIDGLAPRSYVERNGVAYLPELMTWPLTWRTDEALMRMSILAGIPAERRRAEIDRVIDAVGIGEHRKKKLKALSKGNLQRVGLAHALLTDRAMVIFDEPTHGLDPVWTARFRDIVAGIRRPDRAVLVASHNLDELERLCDRVAIVDQGSIIAIGSPREIQQRTLGHSRIEIVVERPLDDATPPESIGADKVHWNENRTTLTVSSPHPARAVVELVKWIDQQGVGLADIHLKRPTLEDVFIELTGKRLRE